MDEQYLKAIVFYRYYLKNRIYFVASFIEGKSIALVCNYHIVHFTPILISCNFMAIASSQSANGLFCYITICIFVKNSTCPWMCPLMFFSIVSNVEIIGNQKFTISMFPKYSIKHPRNPNSYLCEKKQDLINPMMKESH